MDKKFELFDLENNKYFQELNQKYDSKNEQIFKLFEEHNILINNLNLKLEKIKNNIELESKKKFNHLTEKIEKSIVQLGESNIALNNESHIDNNITGINNINNKINNQAIKFENFEKEIKFEINKIYELISNNNKKINLIENKAKDEEIEENNKKQNISKNNEELDKNQKIFTFENNKNNTNNENQTKRSQKNSKKSSTNNDIPSIESLLLQDND